MIISVAHHNSSKCTHIIVPTVVYYLIILLLIPFIIQTGKNREEVLSVLMQICGYFCVMINVGVGS